MIRAALRLAVLVGPALESDLCRLRAIGASLSSSSSCSLMAYVWLLVRWEGF